MADVDKRVEQYVAIRDALAALKTEYDEKKAPLLKLQEELAGWLQSALEKNNAEQIRTESGTVYSTTRYSATLADPDAFMNFIAKTGNYELLDRRANSTAVRDYVEEHDALPPGCNLTALKTVGVRRA